MNIFIDKEPPKVQSCPKDQFISTGFFPHVVHWEDAVFHDNVDGNNTSVFPSIFSGSHFVIGKHTVTYTGVDKSFNKATCTFTIELESKYIRINFYSKPNRILNIIFKDHLCKEYFYFYSFT